MKKLLPYFFLFLFLSCQNKPSNHPVSYLKIQGETMGTTYHITYLDSLQRNFKKEVDLILVEINQGVSTYIPDSDISIFNKSKSANSGISSNEDSHFLKVFKSSLDIFTATDGHFDPTVMPLVNYWGFGYQAKKPVNQVDSLKVDALKKSIGLKKINLYTSRVVDGKVKEILYPSKTNPNTQLDFSAIAKGYAVDVLCEFFDQNNIPNYLVEIGGELRTKGKNPKGKFWTTAINTPKINAQLNEYAAIIQLDNKAIATSGNYRNFYQVGDDWYGHTINPKTGFPEKSNLLSVSVMSNECETADAFATAMMVMGLEKSKALVEKLDYLDAFFIFANEAGELETFYTKGFEGMVVQ